MKDLFLPENSVRLMHFKGKSKIEPYCAVASKLCGSMNDRDFIRFGRRLGGIFVSLFGEANLELTVDQSISWEDPLLDSSEDGRTIDLADLDAMAFRNVFDQSQNVCLTVHPRVRPAYLEYVWGKIEFSKSLPKQVFCYATEHATCLSPIRTFTLADVLHANMFISPTFLLNPNIFITTGLEAIIWSGKNE